MFKTRKGGEQGETCNKSAGVDVLLALAIGQTQAQDECPSLEELAAWYDQKLTDSHAKVVKSHVARCEQCYATWTDLVEWVPLGQRAASPITAPRRRAHWWLGGGLASAVSGVLVVSMVMVSTPFDSILRTIDGGYAAAVREASVAPIEEQWAWRNGWQTRSFAVATQEDTEQPQHSLQVVQQAFRNGVKLGLEEIVQPTPFWREILTAFPSQATSCIDASSDANCAALDAVFQSVGRWVVSLHFACQAHKGGAEFGVPSVDSQFWAQQMDIVTQLAPVITELTPDSLYSRFFDHWSQSAAPSNVSAAELICSQQGSLLSYGLQQ